MRIGIDARLYGTKHAGLGRYIQKLIERLEKIDLENEYVIFLSQDNFDDYQTQSSNFHKVLANFKAYSWGEQILFPGVIKKQKLDLMHFTHFNVPRFYWGRYFVTIHDLIISHYPDSRATTLNPILYKLKLMLYNRVVKRAARRAEKVIAISKFTKSDIIKLLGVDGKDIEVVYEGSESDSVKVKDQKEVDCDSVLSELGIKGDYLLYVGSAYPHKNLEGLIKAFSEIVSKFPNLKLVLVGKRNFFYERLEKFISEFDLAGRVVLTDYVPDENLNCLYLGASLYVFPSFIEGFGLPPLEAQRHGLAVVSSNMTCLPEILDDSAEYFDPQNIMDMANKISGLLLNNSKRDALIEKGNVNYQKYSWQTMAGKILKLYLIEKK
jgi:glycosyltransferase involved in cell wall biosynthesis